MADCQFVAIELPDGRFRHVAPCGARATTSHAKYFRMCDCGNAPPPAPQSHPGLGDKVAVGLEILGITKEKFSEWIGKECNCPERQEKLNRFGRYLAKRAEKLGITLPF